jgi:protein involved in polysaccharide export with SLBB domain
VETTDFSRSFIGRGGRRLPVDFEKLFLHGDLTQNIALEPGDYLSFPAAAAGAIHVLGEVRAPGAVPFDSDTNALSAIASRGGFTARAWKKHVLVVRGSLPRPETFKVDAHNALAGRAPNLALQPGDLVYVSSRPWIRAEELLDRATSAFVEAAVISWTGLHVGPGGNNNPIVVP